MNLRKTSIAFLVLLMSASALAANMILTIEGGMDSGGGKGVVCFNHASTNRKVLAQDRAIYDEDLADIQSIAMLDFQYSVDSFGLKNLIGSEEGSSEYNIYDRVINQKLFFAPGLKDRIGYHYLKMFENIRNRNAPLKGTFDENDMAIYENSNCVLTQLAVQQDLGPKLTVVHLDGRLFNHAKHSELSKFSLLLHEAIYYYLRKNAAAINSAFSRELVSTLLLNKRSGGEEIVQKFIDSGFLAGPASLDVEGDNYTFDDLFNARHYLYPNSVILRYALSLPANFSGDFFNEGFVYQLKKAGWVEKAAQALGSSDYPSQMFKKMSALNNGSFNELQKEYVAIFDQALLKLDAELENEIEGMRAEYAKSNLGDKNEANFDLMLEDLKKLAHAYAQLYIKDSVAIASFNKKMPKYREELIKLLGPDLILKFEAQSPFFMRSITKEDQIPETHPLVYGFPKVNQMSKGSEYYNTQFLLHLLTGLIEDFSFQEHFFNNVTVPEVHLTQK